MIGNIGEENKKLRVTRPGKLRPTQEDKIWIPLFEFPLSDLIWTTLRTSLTRHATLQTGSTSVS